jgi:hypothetical protein
MPDKLCFVQFIHPGGEHEPDFGAHKSWNKGNHKRKFLRQRGKYVARGTMETGEIVFWGEWEPESVADRKIQDPLPRGPRFIYTPYYVVPKTYNGFQNTDPFVFGEQFRYTWCQQRGTQLRHLSEGSVILFGSCEGKTAFVVDTVFVVEHWIEHTKTDYLRVLAGTSQEYREVTIFPGYQAPSGEHRACLVADARDTWRLYFGANFENPVHGMYSYFPCLPYEANSKGFVRPKISLSGKITENLYQGKKYSEQPTLDTMKLLWDRVAEQVKAQGLALGVYAEMPERRLMAAVAADIASTNSRSFE